MKTSVLFILFAFIILPLCAIDYVEGPHTISPNYPNDRQSTVAWHHGIDDQHWYGTNKWAVRYQFNDLFTESDTVLFTASTARIFLPNIVDTVAVSLYSDEAYSPSLLLARGSALQAMGWIDINLVPIDNIQYPLARPVLWLVVSLSTTASGPYMAAENTGGSNSYFWNNSPGVNPYFQSMQSLGYSSEFLISIIGEYSYINQPYEAELQSFQLSGDVVVGSLLHPIFTIRNASQNTLSNVKLKLNIVAADPEFTVVDSVVFEELSSQSILVVNSDNSETYFSPIRLLDDPCQYQFTARLETNHAETLDHVVNNIVTGSFDTFNGTNASILIENFLHNNLAANLNLNGVEDYYANAQTVIMNYYPNASDTLFLNEAHNRYTFYGGIGYPESVFNGIYRFHGFNAVIDSSEIEDNIEASGEEKTFIRENRQFQPYQQGSIIYQEFMFENRNTYLFDSYLDRCRFYVALVETIPLNSILPQNIFVGLVAQDDSITTLLTHGETRSRTYSMNPEEFENIDTSIDHCSLVYFLQNQDDKRIYLSGIRSLSNITAVQEQNASTPALVLRTYPNPCTASSILKIQLNGVDGHNRHEVKIYNLKGQLVRSFPHGSKNETLIEWDLKSNSGHLVGIGIYLIDLKTIDTNGLEKHSVVKAAVVQ